MCGYMRDHIARVLRALRSNKARGKLGSKCAIDDWRKILTDLERGNLLNCNKAWHALTGCDAAHDANAFFGVSQDAGAKPNMSSPSGGFMTMHRNTRVWSPTRNRWLCASEKLAMFGFPTTPSLAAAAGTPMLDTKKTGSRRRGVFLCMCVPAHCSGWLTGWLAVCGGVGVGLGVNTTCTLFNLGSTARTSWWATRCTCPSWALSCSQL